MHHDAEKHGIGFDVAVTIPTPIATMTIAVMRARHNPICVAGCLARSIALPVSAI